MNKNKHWICPDWPAPVGVHAATTLRTGGVSSSAFQSLNPALHVGDDVDLAKQNREIIKNMLNLPDEPKWLAQVHGDVVVDAAALEVTPAADASFTDKSGVVCAVMTADCLPLLVCTRDGGKIAAIHAGWRGLLAGIIGNTLAAMQAGDVMVWLGPAIGPDCFEVGADVRDAFAGKSTGFISAFKSQDNDKWLADIYQLARIELAALGVADVYGGNCCTVTEAERFYSFRREQQTGRMATLIWRE